LLPIVLTIISILIAATGLTLAITIALKDKKLSRPALRLEVGMLAEDNADNFGIGSKRTLIFGTKETAKGVVLFCPYKIRNPTHLPITNVTLQLSYSKRNLIEGAVITNETEQTATIIETIKAENRRLINLGGNSIISYDIPLIRPKETVTLADLVHLKLAQDTPIEDFADDHLTAIYEKFKRIKTFRGAIIIRATVWSNSLPPIASEIYVLAFAGATPPELENNFTEFAKALWDGKYPQPGIYLNPLRRWRKVYTNERVELIIQNDDRLPMNERMAEEQMESPRNSGYYFMPPWGLYGQSFDLDSYLGVRIKPLRSRTDQPAAP